MRLGCARVLDVLYLHTSHYERVGYQRAMTPPMDCLGAHDCGWLRPGRRNQIFETLIELRRLHVVGVPSERSIAPSRVDGAGARLAEST